MTTKPSFVYLLVCSDNSTYVGATVDVDNRLRKHNGEITGGAHATTSKVAKGQIWSRACYVSGFPDWRAALQFEWRWKQLSRQLSNKLFPLERRMQALHKLLALDKPTLTSVPFCNWDAPPEVHIEMDDVYKYYSLPSSSSLDTPFQQNP
jgi:predicted GIY-YIG superfamily endonuclease